MAVYSPSSLLTRLLRPGETITPDEAEQAAAENRDAAKRASDTRLRELRDSIKWHRTLTMLLAGALAAAVLGLVALAHRPQQIRVALAAVDGSTHRVLETHMIAASTTVDPRVIEATILEWVEAWRMVTSDVRAQVFEVDKVYAHVDENDPFRRQLDEWYQAHDPRERAKTETVTPIIRSSIAESANTYMVYWSEVARGQNGETKTAWRCRITVKIVPVTDASKRFYNNPFGIYVTATGEPQQDNA